MDFTNMTFIGLATVGIVNVIAFFYPNLGSKEKFGISVAAAFLLTFVPVEFGNLFFENIKQALQIAFAVSGTYKLAQKAGGE